MKQTKPFALRPSLLIALVLSVTSSAVLAQTPIPAPAAPSQSQASSSSLPPGTGRDLVESRCASCHALDIIPSHPHKPDDWAEVLDKMIQRGAKASDAELDLIQDYLAKNFSAQ